VNVLLYCVQLDDGYLLKPKHAAVFKLNKNICFVWWVFLVLFCYWQGGWITL